MRAWLMEAYEGVEKLRLDEVQDPEPGPGQVLLRVKLAALNPADAFLPQAMYPARPSLPHILGRDGVGDVIAVGSGVDNSLMGRTLVICPVISWTIDSSSFCCAAEYSRAELVPESGGS